MTSSHPPLLPGLHKTKSKVKKVCKRILKKTLEDCYKRSRKNGVIMFDKLAEIMQQTYRPYPLTSKYVWNL